jgi:hypothetical protein
MAASRDYELSSELLSIIKGSGIKALELDAEIAARLELGEI